MQLILCQSRYTNRLICVVVDLIYITVSLIRIYYFFERSLVDVQNDYLGNRSTEHIW